MIWVRKGIVHVLSLVLLLSLLTGALAVSINVAFGHSAKLESWLAQSNLYSSFVSSAIKQAKTSTANNGQSGGSGGISLNDVAVQQAAQSAFSPILLQQYVHTFLNSNYAWLEGKTRKPEFSIDLSGAKKNFAQQVGQYAQARLATLPVCTPAQLATAEQQLSNDPLSLTCRPSVLSPAAEGAMVTQQLENSGGFLSNPVITADSINPNGGNKAQPYYQKFSAAPRIYRLATQLPWELGAAALLSTIGIIFIAPRKRRGLRRVGIVMLEAGILLVAEKFLADIVFKKVEAKAFNNASVGPLQQSLTNFAHLAESQLVNVNLYFGVAFIVLALAIFVVLIVTRNRTPSLTPAKEKGSNNTPASGEQASTSSHSPLSDDNSTPPKPKRPPLVQ